MAVPARNAVVRYPGGCSELAPDDKPTVVDGEYTDVIVRPWWDEAVPPVFVAREPGSPEIRKYFFATLSNVVLY